MVKKTVIIILLVFGLNNFSHADNHVVTLNITQTKQEIIIRPLLDFTTSENIKEAIDNGIRIQIIAKARLIEPHTWWFDSLIESQNTVLEIDHLSLSKLYIVRNKKTGEQLGFNEYVQMWKDIEKLMHFTFKKPTFKNSKFEMRVMLDKGGLPTAMQLPVLFDSQWDINTPWYQQRINAGE